MTALDPVAMEAGANVGGKLGKKGGRWRRE